MMQKTGGYVNFADALAFADKCNAKGIGGGVRPVVNNNRSDPKAPIDVHNDQSGIYLPIWNNIGGVEPHQDDRYAYLLRFNVKKPDGSYLEGFNIGLNIDIAIGHTAPPEVDGGPENPINWDYALNNLMKELDEQLANAELE